MKQVLNEHKKIAWLILCVLLTLGGLFCLWRIGALGHGLPAETAAERWRGESETAFAQVSCFVPVDEALSEGQIPSCDASVIAVGGDFFSFHPLRLLGGDYLREDDLMHDRVLLDLELAWQLFGGTDLQGMPVRINDRPFVVAGVVERESDDASLAAYTAGQGLYMSCDAYAALTEEANCITAYEYVLAEPVDGYSLKLAQEKFPLGRGEALQNTGRYSYGRLLKLLPRMDERAMQGVGMIYPYWENAARVTENRCARLLLTAILLFTLPLISLIVWLWRLGGKGKEAFAERVFPRLREGVEEAFRRPARRRWEKKHAGEK